MTPDDGEDPGGELPLDAVLALLPEMRLTVPLREALLAASQVDASAGWERDRRYATLDRRVLDAAGIDRITRAAARREAEVVSTLFAGVGEALGQRARGRRREAVTTLVDRADALLLRDRFYEAAAVLEVALAEVSAVDDGALEAGVTRRLGKACWRVGRLERAARLYERAAVLYRQLGEVENEAVAVMGLGNVLAALGRWSDAEARQREALELAGDAYPLLAGQAYNNLSQVTRRQGRLDEARAWQARAEAARASLDAPADRVVAFNNAGLLHLAAGDTVAAREALQEGLGRAGSDLQRAALLVNLAQTELRDGHPERAEPLAREAEAFGILAGATDLVVEAYTVMGTVLRERGDDSCVLFFEKALELAADAPDLPARAAAHRAYADYRLHVGDREEAVAHLERALAVYRVSGTPAEVDATREALERARADGG